MPKSPGSLCCVGLAMVSLLCGCATELAVDPPSVVAAPLLESRVLPSPEPEQPKPKRVQRDREPNPRFAVAHFGAGVAGTMVFSTMSYAIARGVGQRGQGLGPVIGALVIGAFMPPILNYTFQWAVGRTVAPRRDRFWPGFLVRQVVHLGVFVGAVMGGADFNKPGHFAAIVVGEAFVNSGLATMTAELTARPLTTPSSAARLPGPRPIEVVVPILEMKF